MLIFLLLLLGLETGCASTVVIDRDYYQNEIRWLGNAGIQLSRGAVARARAAALKADLQECEAIAGQALVYSIMTPYHTAKALWVADLVPDPGPQPVVPPIRTWCLSAATSSAAHGLRAVDDDPNHPALMLGAP